MHQDLSTFLAERREDCRELVKELKKSFSYVSVLGVDAECTNIRVTSRTSSVSDGATADCGFAVRLYDGGAFYEYSLDDVKGDKKELAARITAALQVDASIKDTVDTRPLADEPLEKTFVRESDFDKYSDAQLLDFCKVTKQALCAKSDNIANAVVQLRKQRIRKLFVSSNRVLEQAYTWVNGVMLIGYREGDKLITAREGACSHLLGYVMATLPSKIDKLVDKAAHLVHAKPIVPGEYDVITDPSVTGLLAHEAFGHGVEMDMFVKDRALAKHCMGQQVASEICNMHDGAAATLSVASYFFDDDGVLASDTHIIRDGILVNGISDLESASELGTAPTGNGRRESHKRKAYTRMTNTFFERGKDKLEDMIASIKHGYMIFETNNGMEDPKSWQVQCVAEYGREIVDGKLTDNYVAPVVMSGYVPDVLKSISMISSDFEVEGAGMCGKGHKEWVCVSDGGPALKLKVRLG